MTVKLPLVSIGVPTYNRADLLTRAISSLTSQDYPNLEIIISDNASTDETKAVCARLAKERPLISYQRLSESVPPTANFDQVLRSARGTYFMWAADDDLWEPDFVSTLVKYLENEPNLALIAAEAQYMLPDGTKLPFFPEGAHYYQPATGSRWNSLLGIASHNYGNLIYGLYRRDVLFTSDDRTCLDMCALTNEIPLFLHVAAKGDISVCERILFYKTTSLPTYLQAAREYGFKPELDQGRLRTTVASFTPNNSTASEQKRPEILVAPKFFFKLFGQVQGSWSYHWRVLKDIERMIWHIKANIALKLVLSLTFFIKMVMHFVKVTIAWPLADIVRGK